jgi:hypothetical protein
MPDEIHADRQMPDALLIDALENHARSCDALLGAFGDTSLKGGALYTLGLIMRLAAVRIRQIAAFFEIPAKPPGPPITESHHVGVYDVENAEVRSATEQVFQCCSALHRAGHSHWAIQMALANTVAVCIGRMEGTTMQKAQMLLLVEAAIKTGIDINIKTPKSEVM